MLNIINIDNWERKEHYQLFINQSPCTFSISAKINIDKLLKNLDKSRYKFYPVILFFISKVINNHKEFKMKYIDEEKIGFYDEVFPSHLLFHKDKEIYSDIWTEYDENIDKFMDNYEYDIKKYKSNYELAPKGNKENLFNFSCLPWLHYEHINLNLVNDKKYFAPIITMGKYTKENQNIMLPITMQVNHAVCDGFHVARFFNELQDLCNDFSERKIAYEFI